ncbi:DUF99 family protein [Methanohalobium sp.]|uniref:endonuclease dU n=1 Tax=Methanohalobium sp. TaxID=2837493 RepID=UPI0025F09D5C|nr:DUF99 family protein [Methanohalobium sp.]
MGNISDKNTRLHIKSEIRVLGIDDSALLSDRIMIVGAVFRGGDWLDGVLRSEITRDGMDGTDTIIQMVKPSKHFVQLRVIMLDGITFGGFNPIDIVKLNDETGLPVVAIMRKYPDFKKIESALKYLPEPEKRMDIIKKAGEIAEVTTYADQRASPLYIQWAGIEEEDARRIVQQTSTRSNIPEPLRVAHLIATGVVFGESRGKA